jgi:hypothetical protein
MKRFWVFLWHDGLGKYMGMVFNAASEREALKKAAECGYTRAHVAHYAKEC